MKKQIFAFLAVVFLSVSLLAVPAKANNYKDTSFYFSFSPDNIYQETEPRTKEDTSSAYMKCTDSSTRYYLAWVVGDYDDVEFDASVNPNNSSDVRHYGICEGSEGQYMINWVKETANANGWSSVQARIRAKRCIPSQDFDASGVWSPDNYHRR